MPTELVTEVDGRLALSLTTRRIRPTLSWNDGAHARTANLEAPIIIGSSEQAQVSLPRDRLVSRVHAELMPKADGVWVRDLGSRNGTWLEGIRVHEARVPEVGGTIRVGDTAIQVASSPSAPVKLWPTDRLHDVVGKSEPMRELLMRVSELARTDAPVLIEGETGTGKEVMARALHASSARHAGPFIVVDCGALAESLLEAELFGHSKGAYTGAHSARVGAFEAASGGTVFLDEIGELPLSMQPRLLRVLESKTVKRLGENEHRAVDLRVVSATHRDLESMVADGTFREDLYFRLAVLPLRVPPLRGHPEDIEVLAEHFLAGRATLPAGAQARLSSYAWPGNVRELRSVMERTAALGFEAAWAMVTGATTPTPVARGTAPTGGPPRVDIDVPFKELREQWADFLELQYLTALITRHGRHSPTELAEAAGLDRSYMHRLLKKHLL